MAKRRVHLILGPGGIRTISYIGAIRKLQQKGIEFASISGCSAGTIIAAAICAGASIDKIDAFLIENNLQRYSGRWDLFAKLRWPYAGYKDSGAGNAIKALLNADPLLGELKTPFATTGIDIVSQELLVYSTIESPEMSLSTAVTIATSVPFMYLPYEDTVNNRLVVDAAIATDCPIWLTPLKEERLPIIALNTRSTRRTSEKRDIKGYIESIISAGITTSDDTLLPLIPNIFRLIIDNIEIETYEFGASKRAKRAIVDAGAAALENSKIDYWLDDTSNDANISYLPDTPSSRFAKGIIVQNQFIIENSQNVSLSNISQTIHTEGGPAPGLDQEELAKHVAEMRKELEALRAQHTDEVAILESRLKEVLDSVSKPATDSKSSLLNLSSDGLLSAAKALSAILPTVLPLAQNLVTFITTGHI